MMQSVVQEGTGTAAAVSGIDVAGKTGTAEISSGVNDAWFIGFAPASDPQIAIAGESYAQLEAAGVDFEVGEVSFDDQGRARCMGRNAAVARRAAAVGCGSIADRDSFQLHSCGRQ